MLEVLAAAVAHEHAWDALVQAVITAKADLGPLIEPLHRAEVVWNVERAVAQRDRREPSAELGAAYERALADVDAGRKAVQDAQAAMKAGVQ